APAQPVERALAGLGMLADDPMLLARRAVVARRRLEQRLDQGRDLETENLGIALLGDAAAHGGDVESRGWVFKGTGRPYRAVPPRRASPDQRMPRVDESPKNDRAASMQGRFRTAASEKNAPPKRGKSKS